MKIDITHSEKTTGWISKKTYYTTTVQVQFSEEEKHVIKQNKLEKHIVAERPPRAGTSEKDANNPNLADIWDLRVSTLLKGEPDTWEFYTPAETKDYQEKVMAGLKGIKAFVQQNATPVANTSIEL
jgi:hypothetical protein